jgi:hypothetical protein
MILSKRYKVLVFSGVKSRAIYFLCKIARKGGRVQNLEKEEPREVKNAGEVNC